MVVAATRHEEAQTLGELECQPLFNGPWSGWNASIPMSPAPTSSGTMAHDFVCPGCARIGTPPCSRMARTASTAVGYSTVRFAGLSPLNQH